MRIASNKVSDLIQFYRDELKCVYSHDEIEFIIQQVFRHYMHFSKTDLVTKKDENMNHSELLLVYDCCKDLKNNKPLQYILKEVEFYHSIFNVNEAVLIPRPETEELVEKIVKDLIARENSKILDVGTGSGCIAISLQKHLKNSSVFAIDVSEKALEVARENALINKTDVAIIKMDVLNPKECEHLVVFDAIVSNPPYIAKKEAGQMHSRVKDHEPHLALFVEDDDPLVFYKRIIELCKKHLNKGGALYFELNPVYANEIRSLADESKQFIDIKLLNDMSGNTRFLKAIK